MRSESFNYSSKICSIQSKQIPRQATSNSASNKNYSLSLVSTAEAIVVDDNVQEVFDRNCDNNLPAVDGDLQTMNRKRKKHYQPTDGTLSNKSKKKKSSENTKNNLSIRKSEEMFIDFINNKDGIQKYPHCK
jgi:hypothetical protein